MCTARVQICLLITVLTWSFSSTPAAGFVLPSFNLDECVAGATHIVLAHHR